MSGSHIIVGATGTGKTTFIKNMLKKVKNKKAIFIYDVNNEYSDYYPYKFDPDYESFTDKMVKLQKSVIVFEESTIFLNNRSCNANIVDLLIRKRHAENFYFFVFHSVRSIPRYIFEYSNYITIFHTNDSPELSARELKDHRICEMLLSIREKKNEKKYQHKNKDGSTGSHYCETLKIY